ncbi:arylsulfotransferase family protein [Nocardia sp. XZ_19_385]|uniref:arylsulfotransferase family protein n=1 Tax=Nocardia sp. XZ_19_385 TaxID=2769488 RepID=UPI00188F9DAC|nr:arylsulfotransferase family protein [Nocardia sp. XZ_19_385]
MHAPDATHFLFSPSATYPRPVACLINRDGEIVHAWSSGLDQPDPATRPPSYLRGWNHVELDTDGNLYATVPLHSLLKLAPDSSLLWRAELPVHHDLALTATGQVYVLTEHPRLLEHEGEPFVLLDNAIAVLDGTGALTARYSLFDLLTTNPALSALITSHIELRRRSPHHRSTLRIYHDLAIEDVWAGHEVSRLLREVPGSPADVLHTNTIEILAAHPDGLWAQGDVLVSMRELDCIAVVDIEAGVVRWWWGPGELSGQHQPTLLPDGHLLVFDNGRPDRHSRVLELDPVDSTICWQYVADPPQTLSSPVAGGAEPLANSNVVISDAQGGRALEITRDGTLVWAVATVTTTGERAQFYRMAAVTGQVAAGLGSTAVQATQRAREMLRCELLTHRRTT